MILLLGLLFILCGAPSLCLEEHGFFFFDGDFRHFAVDNNTVYIATEEKLYQLNHDLTPVHSLTMKGVLKPSNDPGDPRGTENFHRVSGAADWNATFRVNVLLPFAENRSVISCGVTDNECGYCEILDLKNISNILYKENFQVGPTRRSDASVGFLVTLKNNQPRRDTFILTAIQQGGSGGNCPSDSRTLNLHNTDSDLNKGGIFSLNAASGKATIDSNVDLKFVDGFQIDSIIYLLSNVPSGARNNKVHLIWLEDKLRKLETLKSLRGATLSLPGGGEAGRLLASSVISGGPPRLWSGVFSVDGGQTNTELLLFDISPDLSGPPDNDLDSYFKKASEGKSKILHPKAVLLRQSYMTSVLAVRQKEWMVFFIGTGDGQLIKLAVDRNYHAACPRVLYRSNEDRRVFPRMQLDPFDHKHVYVPFQNEMKRVAVARCSTYTNVKECWTAQDPYCVWCGAKESCTFEEDCEGSDWLSIPDVFQKKMISHKIVQDSIGELTLNIQIHVKVNKETRFACQISPASGSPCRNGPPPQFPQCTCILSNHIFPPEGLRVAVKMTLGSAYVNQQLQLMNCSNISELPTPVWCQQCINAGCGWSNNGCTWANEGVQNDSVCQSLQSELNFSKPEISSIAPSIVSFYGRNHAVLSGRNLSAVTGVRLQADRDCTPQESPVWNNTGTSLTFHIPSSSTKETIKVCALLPDGSCHGNASITYRSSPSCRDISPRNSWISGGRNITLNGTHLDFVEGILHSHATQEVQFTINYKHQIRHRMLLTVKWARFAYFLVAEATLTYASPAATNLHGVSSSSVLLKVANETLRCSTITYYPDPEFIGFTSSRSGDDVHIIIEKKADKLEMTTAELSVWGEQDEKQYPCIMEDKDESNETDFFNCEIQSPPNAKFRKIMIKYGNKTVPLEQSQSWLMFLLLALLLIPCIIVAVVIVSRRQQKKLNAQMNRFMEDLELDIRNDIRQGFVDLQTEKADLMESVGAIPFLDYKHFASRIFFPESDSLMALCVQDIGQVKIQLDECSQNLSKLIQDQVFLRSMVHALEEQKSFTIKDKCALASLLTVALHGNLSYLTEVMEVLLKDLMQQSSNAQPKLLLRRTESIVEKLLTNWMSICLYGFLRESVGQNLFLMVSALSQQIAKGPVDCVTEKALYTLSEDWLLWQAPDFSAVKLRVLFAVGTDGEVSEPLEVEALSCDTVEQVKEKILSTFKAKFGFPYNTSLRDARIELEKDGSFLPLEEVDSSSEVIGEVTMLNTLKHYKVEDGATIKVLSRKSHRPLSPQGSVKDDENFSGKYFHLIDPDVVEDQRKNPERKKLKVKEVHLTKLLSTKVAVHSFVENLFRSIWGTAQSKPPHAVKYFFNFLDAQAENMKISDPDVLHIWKTNSLPLRFWINILKNPQFVFDMEKSPHLDGCLSVIAQAFMDSFSLSETQLGKHAPTNKLLYAKDIPKFKQEVKAYYKQIRDPPHITESQFQEFLREESKKHENEFNEAAALRELYKFILRYFTEIKEKLDENGAPAELLEQLQHVKDSFNGLKSCSWN